MPRGNVCGASATYHPRQCWWCLKKFWRSGDPRREPTPCWPRWGRVSAQSSYSCGGEMTVARSTDVFIIGGGPAGLAAAIAARERGFEVIVADRARGPIDKAC